MSISAPTFGAFGAVLYELLAGRRPFLGSTFTETLACVLKEEPDWTRVPEAAQRLLRKCMVKDPAKRLRDIGDAMELVGEAQVGQLRHSHHNTSWTRWAMAGVAALGLVGLSVAGGRWFSRVPEAENWSGSTLGGPEIALDPRVSPDGRLLAFQAIDQGQAQVAVMTPESGNWSVLTHNRELGSPLEIAWSRDGTSIYYDRYTDVPQGIYSVPVLGGDEKLVLENATTPEVLPDGTLLVYRLNAQRSLQLFRYWPETGRLQDLPIISRANTLLDELHIRASPDGKEAVVVGTPLGHDKEPDRLLAVDVNTGVSMPLTPPGVTLEGNAAAVARDGKSVVLAMREEALTRVVSIPLKNPLEGKFAPRTLFTTTSSIWFLDTGTDDKVYVNAMEGSGEVVRFTPDGSRIDIIGSVGNQDSDAIVSLPDGRTVIVATGLGRHRLMAVAKGKNPVALVSTIEETSSPMAAAGPRAIAFVIGRAPHTTIALADTASGRITNRISPGKGQITAMESSPDGKTIYFSAGGKIWSVPPAGGEASPIRAGDGVTAAPDGRSLLISTIENGKARLFRVAVGESTLDGSREREIAADGSSPLAPPGVNPGTLRADGRLLVLLTPPDSWFLVAGILDTRTGHVSRFPQLSNVAGLSWTSDGQIAGIARRPISTLWRFQAVGK